jgi:hypothetical protein
MKSSVSGVRIFAALIVVLAMVGIGGIVYGNMADANRKAEQRKQVADAEADDFKRFQEQEAKNGPSTPVEATPTKSNSAVIRKFLTDKVEGIAADLRDFETETSDIAKRAGDNPAPLNSLDYVSSWYQLKRKAARHDDQVHALQPPEACMHLVNLLDEIADKELASCTAMAEGVKTSDAAKMKDALDLTNEVTSLTEDAGGEVRRLLDENPG